MQPTVVINQHRQTAIIIASSEKKLQLIKLTKGKLRVTALSHAQFQSQGYITDNYPPELAAQSYLKHGAGVSKSAQHYLELISQGKYSESLAL